MRPVLACHSYGPVVHFLHCCVAIDTAAACRRNVAGGAGCEIQRGLSLRWTVAGPLEDEHGVAEILRPSQRRGRQSRLPVVQKGDLLPPADIWRCWIKPFVWKKRSIRFYYVLKKTQQYSRCPKLEQDPAGDYCKPLCDHRYCTQCHVFCEKTNINSAGDSAHPLSLTGAGYALCFSHFLCPLIIPCLFLEDYPVAT